MGDDSKVEVNRELLKEFFKMANMEMPEEVSDDNLMDVMMKIKNPEISAQPVMSSDNPPEEGELNSDGTKNILVVDDIGVVTYQLKVMLQNLGYGVKVAKDIFNGVNSFIHSSFAYVVMDLFVSTEQEGYTLLNEIKKVITQNNLNTKIIVITASSKAENKVRCLNGGADFFLKKDIGWQDRLIEYIESNKPAQA